MTAVGDVLTATDPDLPGLRVLGSTEGGRWIVREADEFGTPRILADDEIEAYGADPRAQPSSEDEGWKRLAEAPHRRPVMPPRPKSPEEHLRDGSADRVTALAADGTVFTPSEQPKVKGQSGAWVAVRFTERPARREGD